MSSPRTRTASRVIAVATALAGLGGCSDYYYDRRDTIAFHAGDAAASNIAVQTIDPWPRDAANRHLYAHGERMQGAIERYKAGKTTPLAGTGTSSVQYAPILFGPVSK